MSILAGMFLIMFTLKLLGHITVSWLWVTAPIWLPAVVVFAVLGICWLVEKPLSWGQKRKQNLNSWRNPVR